MANVKQTPIPAAVLSPISGGAYREISSTGLARAWLEGAMARAPRVDAPEPMCEQDRYLQARIGYPPRRPRGRPRKGLSTEALADMQSGSPGAAQRVAALAGVSSSTVYRRAREAGQTLRRGRPRVQCPADVAEALRAGESARSIARRTGRHVETICRWARVSGIELRGRGRPRKGQP